MSAPAVSVVIPTFDRAELVLRAIESVLAQTYRDFEVVVVDDGSTDDTRHVLDALGPPVRVVRHEVNRGRSAARNTGIRAARGRFIGFLDADDIWLPEKLERQVPLLEAGADVVHSLVYVAAEDGTIQREPSERGFRLFRESAAAGLGYSSFLRRSACQLNTLMVRRSCIDEVGAFDEDMAAIEDLDFMHRLLRRYRFALVDEPLAKYCMHTANTPGTTLAHGWTVLALRELAYVRTRPDLQHDRALRAFLLVRLAQSRYILGEYRKMRAPLARALAIRPQVLLDREVVKYLACALAPRALVDRARLRRRERPPTESVPDPWIG